MGLSSSQIDKRLDERSRVGKDCVVLIMSNFHGSRHYQLINHQTDSQRTMWLERFLIRVCKIKIGRQSMLLEHFNEKRQVNKDFPDNTTTHEHSKTHAFYSITSSMHSTIELICRLHETETDSTTTVVPYTQDNINLRLNTKTSLFIFHPNLTITHSIISQVINLISTMQNKTSIPLFGYQIIYLLTG